MRKYYQLQVSQFSLLFRLQRTYPRQISSDGIFDVVQFKLHGFNTDAVVEVEAFVVDNPIGLLPALPYYVVKRVVDHGFEPMADVCYDGHESIDLILGEDVYDEVVKGPTHNIGTNFRVTWTIFGWMVHGCTSDVVGGDSAAVVNFCSVDKVNNLERFWELEHIGISDFHKTDFEVDAVLGSLRRDLDGRYSVALPWRSDLRPSRNYDVALGRLKRLSKKLSPREYVLYDDAIKTMVVEGYVEKAPEVESATTCYVPHRPVFRDVSSTTKTRMVLDPSIAAKHEGLALNECLQQGPNFLPDLFGVMLRFRLGRFALTGDFEKAFLQIRVHESDRDVLRFLWGDSVFRMTSVPFGLTCSPSILQIVLRHHLQNCNGDAGVIDLILRSLYVDDVIVSVFEENVAVKIWDEAVRIMALAKINLR